MEPTSTKKLPLRPNPVSSSELAPTPPLSAVRWGAVVVTARVGAAVEGNERIGERAAARGGPFDANGIVLGGVQNDLEPVVVALQLDAAVNASVSTLRTVVAAVLLWL